MRPFYMRSFICVLYMLYIGLHKLFLDQIYQFVIWLKVQLKFEALESFSRGVLPDRQRLHF